MLLEPSPPRTLAPWVALLSVLAVAHGSFAQTPPASPAPTSEADALLEHGVQLRQ
jgi:hypothetical protein